VDSRSNEIRVACAICCDHGRRDGQAMSKFSRLVTGTEMMAIDRHTIDHCGISSVELMERAGARVVETLAERFGGLQGLRVAVVCGKGNNGGDGFVVARRLLEEGLRVDAFLGVARAEIVGEAGDLLGRFEQLGGQAVSLPIEGASAALHQGDVVIDALLGTGLHGAPRAGQTVAIEAINACSRPVIAIDLPSGVDANTGAVAGVAVRATVTVSFGLAKRGHLFAPGRAHCGALELVDIGFPDAAIDACGGSTFLLAADGVARQLPTRKVDAHKGTCGSALVVAGSMGMSGAAALAADAALRAGTGRVSVGVPESLHDILETKLTEVMTRPLPEVRRHRCLSLRALGDIMRLVCVTDALAIGPGLGRHRGTIDLVRRLLRRRDLPPTVIDADALYAIGDGTDLLGPGRVVTPHVGEFSRMTGLAPETIVMEPVARALEYAVQHRVVVVLKGGPTVVAAPDGRAFVNPTGNPGMATAGSGDVLTGAITALMAQGCEPLEAALSGVYLHGLAGDRARDHLGEWGLRAGDILQRLPEAFVEVAGSAR
jgi:ADP-dependent NAD(P)H-hydrate dehydratase / NAD(P)H-hydrate epimerase